MSPLFIFIEPFRYFYSKIFFNFKLKKVDNSFFQLSKDSGFQAIKLPTDLIDSIIQNTINLTRNRTLNDKPYLKALTNIGDYKKDSPEMTLATHPQLLKSVQNYLGHAPYLYDITALHSPAPLNESQNESEKYSGSQLFHRDGDDIRIVKVWILCSDVGHLNGPTTLLDAKLSEKISRKIRYKQESKISLEVEKNLNLSENELQKAIGNSGTIYATDTVRLLHFGSRTDLSSERLVLMFHYVSFYSCYFRRFAKRGKRKFLHPSINYSELDPYQRLALRGYLN